jgi:hypothetical protein
MLSDAKRPDFDDLETQIKRLRENAELDIDGDGEIDVVHIPTIMALLGEPKCTPERLEDIRNLLLDGRAPGDTRVPIDEFLTTIRNSLVSYGSEKEVSNAQTVPRGFQDLRRRRLRHDPHQRFPLLHAQVRQNGPAGNGRNDLRHPRPQEKHAS